MEIGFWIFLMITCIFDGLLGGASLLKVVVELPARKKLGAITFAHYGRAADLGNGRFFYPLLGIGGASLTVLSMAWGLILQFPLLVMVPFYIASSLGVLHTIITARAAPQMLKIARSGDTVDILQSLQTGFAYWSNWRAAFQLGTFLVFIWGITNYAIYATTL